MLNEIIPIQTKQVPINNQATAHPDNPKESAGEQFNDILGREVAEKMSQSKNDNNSAHETAVASEEKSPSSEEAVQNSTLAHQAEKNNTTRPHNPISPNTTYKTQSDETLIPHTSPENSTGHPVTPQPQVISALTQSSNELSHIPTLPISPGSPIGPNAISQLQTVSALTQPHGQPNHTSTPHTFLGNNTGSHITPPNQIVSGLIQSSNQPDQPNQPGLNPVIPGKNPTVDTAITPHLLNQTDSSSNLNSATTTLSHQLDFHLENRLHIRSNLSHWQSVQTANFADNGNLLPFPADITKEWLLKHNEPMTLVQNDYDAVLQPSANHLTKTHSQQTIPTVAAQPITLDAQFGQPKWNHEFAQKIVLFAKQHHQVAELRLNPAHLGPVEIMLSMSNDNGTQASAQFVSPHLAVREAIEAALPRLRELMAESGIQLGNVMVGAESSQQHERHEQHPPSHLASDTQSLKTQGYDDSRSERAILIRKHSGIINTYA